MEVGKRYIFPVCVVRFIPVEVDSSNKWDCLCIVWSSPIVMRVALILPIFAKFLCLGFELKKKGQILFCTLQNEWIFVVIKVCFRCDNVFLYCFNSIRSFVCFVFNLFAKMSIWGELFCFSMWYLSILSFKRIGSTMIFVLIDNLIVNKSNS